MFTRDLTVHELSDRLQPSFCCLVYLQEACSSEALMHVADAFNKVDVISVAYILKDAAPCCI